MSQYNERQWYNFGKTEGYISTSIITKSRKVTEDVETNDQSTTTYKSVSFKNL